MSAQSLALLTLSTRLTGNVAAHRFVTHAGAQAGAGANVRGTSRTAGATGELIPVDVLGTGVVEAGGNVTAGATLKADADGKAIVWADSGAKVAVALQAGAAGELVEVLLIPNAA